MLLIIHMMRITRCAAHTCSYIAYDVVSDHSRQQIVKYLLFAYQLPGPGANMFLLCYSSELCYGCHRWLTIAQLFHLHTFYVKSYRRLSWCVASNFPLATREDVTVATPFGGQAEVCGHVNKLERICAVAWSHPGHVMFLVT